MSHTGILRAWHDDRGFGFIAPTQGGPELFVHISAFARDGSRPTVGETLRYELGRGEDGKPQAFHVIRAAFGSDVRTLRSHKQVSRSTGSNWLGVLLTLALVVGGGAFGYKHVKDRENRAVLQSSPALFNPQSVRAAPFENPGSSSFRCDGRTMCSQMSSCAEATWFINHCPGTKMDGNSDGVPCEQQWCR